jgi:hypothetical protein
MKIVKMSLVAALLIGSSAFAIENTKVSGDAKLFYSTQDDDAVNSDRDLFGKSSSMGEAAVSIGLTTDLTEGISAGATLNAITTLGLYNNMVSATWTGGTKDDFVFSEAWLAGTVGKTTAKVGRMELDTPLVFSEKWSIVPATFESAVLINQDLPDTTLVAAFVGQHDTAAVTGAGLPADGSTPFASFYNGAYAAGLVNNSFKPLTFQAWYYNADAKTTVAPGVDLTGAQAYWLQADIQCSLVKGVLIGAQYTSINYDTSIAKSFDNNAFAAMLGYEMKDTFTVKASISQTGEEKDSGLALGAGGNLAGTQSKLYTEAWWLYGRVTAADTMAYNFTVTAPVAGYDLGLYYTHATKSDNGTAGVADVDFTEATFEVAKSFGPLDAGVYYIYTQADDLNQKNATSTGDAYNTVQVYLTYNF